MKPKFTEFRSIRSQLMWAVLDKDGNCLGCAETKEDAYSWRSDYEDYEGISTPHAIKIKRCMVEWSK